MRIYSKTLTTLDLNAALPRGVYCDIGPANGNGTRSVGLYRYDAPPEGGRLKNSGRYGADNWCGELAATYDEHGRWMSRLFDIDPDARIGQYASREDFHRMTYGHYSFVPYATDPWRKYEPGPDDERVGHDGRYVREATAA